MAHYQEVDYCSEEVRSVGSPAGFGRHGGGVQQHVVREKFEEVDRVSRTGSHGRHHGHHHGHGPGHIVVRETTVEEDINTCTGEFHERKESYVVRSD
ncbi:unnamed protein product [Urochloa humidicola]